MKIISLGGVGGCQLAEALRKLNQQTYPYDWLLTTQSFIINSFNNFDKFFDFDEKYVYDKINLLMYNKKAIILHDFIDFASQKEEVITKYKRRFQRLNDSLYGNEDILFVRVYDNLEDKLYPIDYYNNIFNRDEENIEIWENFINYIQNKYNKKIKLLIITNKEDICNKQYNNIIMHFTEEYENTNVICNIICKTIENITKK
jgi:hypothetical protein